jgi:hypothetical protein
MFSTSSAEAERLEPARTPRAAVPKSNPRPNESFTIATSSSNRVGQDLSVTLGAAGTMIAVKRQLKIK